MGVLTVGPDETQSKVNVENYNITKLGNRKQITLFCEWKDVARFPITFIKRVYKVLHYTAFLASSRKLLSQFKVFLKLQWRWCNTSFPVES